MAPTTTTLCRLSSRRPKVCEHVVSDTCRGHCRVALRVTISHLLCAGSYYALPARCCRWAWSTLTGHLTRTHTSARTPSFLGIHVWDVEGKQYIDCLSAYSAVNQVSIRLAHAWPP